MQNTFAIAMLRAELIRHLGSQPVRTYVRAMLESLDLQMLYGRQQIPDTVALSEIAVIDEEMGMVEDGVTGAEGETTAGDGPNGEDGW